MSFRSVSKKQIAVGLLIMLFILGWIMIGVAVADRNYCHEDLSFKERVKVVDGFYKDYVGTIVGISSFSKNHYLVDFDALDMKTEYIHCNKLKSLETLKHEGF